MSPRTITVWVRFLQKRRLVSLRTITVLVKCFSWSRLVSPRTITVWVKALRMRRLVNLRTITVPVKCFS